MTIMIKAIILIGGPQKGTRFRPISLDIPKPLFPVAGRPIIQHHIDACVQLKDLKEIIILGSYPESEMEQFVKDMQNLYDVKIKYVKEVVVGIAENIYNFRNLIKEDNATTFFVLNGDVCADFPLQELYDFHMSKDGRAQITIMSTEATKQQSINYGCLVVDHETGVVNHYVEKPSSYVSTFINCGVYVCSMELFNTIHSKQVEIYTGNEGYINGSFKLSKENGHVRWERDVITSLAGTGSLFALPVKHWWSQIKTAGAAIYANRHYLELYKRTHKERLANQGIKTNNESAENLICNIIQDVYIHPTAIVHPSSTLGPNVSIGPGVTIERGVRLRESIVLDNAVIQAHALVLHSIVGRETTIGNWARVEGTPSDPDPNKPFAKMENPSLFNVEGKLNPSITILGCSVTVPSEKIVLNSIVLPHKELSRSFKNEIIL